MKPTRALFGILVLTALVAAFFVTSFPLVSVPVPAFAEDPEPKGGEAATEKGKPGEDEGGSPCPECPECPDPAKVVLRGLEEKKQRIEAEAMALAQEKKELETYEAQIDEKLEQLAALKQQINDDMARLEEKKSRQELDKEAAFEAKMGRLVKMYAGMKPKAAAQIVNQMDLGVAQEIFMRMREASASQVLMFVEAKKAAKISERLAFKKKAF